jgi:hypothetical protein
MADAVSAYLWSPLPFASAVETNDAHACPYIIELAWASYTCIFDISFASHILWPNKTRNALSWLTLKHNTPSPHLLATVLPRTTVHSFHEDHPRRQHEFWLDAGY